MDDKIGTMTTPNDPYKTATPSDAHHDHGGGGVDQLTPSRYRGFLPTCRRLSS